MAMALVGSATEMSWKFLTEASFTRPRKLRHQQRRLSFQCGGLLRSCTPQAGSPSLCGRGDHAKRVVMRSHVPGSSTRAVLPTSTGTRQALTCRHCTMTAGDDATLAPSRPLALDDMLRQKRGDPGDATLSRSMPVSNRINS